MVKGDNTTSTDTTKETSIYVLCALLSSMITIVALVTVVTLISARNGGWRLRYDCVTTDVTDVIYSPICSMVDCTECGYFDAYPQCSTIITHLNSNVTMYADITYSTTCNDPCTYLERCGGKSQKTINSFRTCDVECGYYGSYVKTVTVTVGDNTYTREDINDCPVIKDCDNNVVGETRKCYIKQGTVMYV